MTPVPAVSSRLLRLSPAAVACTDELKHAAESKEPLGMSCVSDASADESGPKSGPHDHSGRAVIGKSAHARSVVHFSNLIECDGVKTSAEEGRESE